jgi:hypothetical protein
MLGRGFAAVLLGGLCLAACGDQPTDEAPELGAEEPGLEGPCTPEEELDELGGPGMSPQGLAGPTSAGKYRVWPNGRIPYAIGADVGSTTRSDLLSAMGEWENKSGGCVRFVAKTSSDSAYLQVNSGNPASGIGYTGGVVTMTLRNPEPISVIRHELAHTLGFHHEHRRSDRLNYIQVRTANIVNSTWCQGQFNVCTDCTLVKSFHVTSINHYRTNRDMTSCFVNGNPVLYNKDGSAINHEWVITAGDLDALDALYGCGATGTGGTTGSGGTVGSGGTTSSGGAPGSGGSSGQVCDIWIGPTGATLEENGRCADLTGSNYTSVAGHDGHAFTTVADVPAPDYADGIFWLLRFTSAGRYRVRAWVPSGVSNLIARTRYKVQHAGTATNAEVNQAAHAGSWAELGVFEFAAGGDQWVRLGDYYVDGADQGKRVVFDAIQLESAPPDGAGGAPSGSGGTDNGGSGGPSGGTDSGWSGASSGGSNSGWGTGSGAGVPTGGSSPGPRQATKTTDPGESGCGCRVSGRRRPLGGEGLTLLAFALLGLAVRRSRRDRRGRA